MNNKLALVGSAGSVWAAMNAITVELFNVPIGVVNLAIVGALLSYGYDFDEKKKPISRKRYFASLITNVIASTSAVTIMPGVLGWDWYNTKMEGSVAFLLALTARFTIPKIFRAIQTFNISEGLRKWFRVGEYKELPKKEVIENERSD